MAFSLLERSVFIITSWGAGALWRTRYPALRVLHQHLLSWKTGKLPALGRESCSCSACSYLGRATILCRSLKAQQSGLTPELLPLTNPQEAPQLLGSLGNSRERGNLACSTPCKTQAATEPVFPSVQAGPCPAPGCWLEGEDPTSQLREVIARFRLLENSIPQVNSGLIGARRSPDDRLWLFRVAHPPLRAPGGLLQLQQGWRARTSYYHEPGLPQPPFHTKIRIAPLSESAAPDSWLLLRSKPYLIFPLPLQAVVHFLKTFHNRSVLNRKGNILKILCGADFSISTV